MNAVLERIRRIRWRRLLVELALGAALFWAILAWQGRNLLDAGRPAPPLALPTLDGGYLDLAELRGRKVVVVFWAPWCGVCKAEMPTLRGLAADGVPVVAVALAYPDRTAVERFASRHAEGLPVLLGTERTAADWSVQAYPTLYVVDERGRIEHAVVGYTTGIGLRLRLL